jgi:hypothetical protein
MISIYEGGTEWETIVPESIYETGTDQATRSISDSEDTIWLSNSFDRRDTVVAHRSIYWSSDRWYYWSYRVDREYG